MSKTIEEVKYSVRKSDIEAGSPLETRALRDALRAVAQELEDQDQAIRFLAGESLKSYTTYHSDSPAKQRLKRLQQTGKL